MKSNPDRCAISLRTAAAFRLVFFRYGAQKSDVAPASAVERAPMRGESSSLAVSGG
jgi:hypothetical protein